jgi:C-22 sterol desaturase
LQGQEHVDYRKKLVPLFTRAALAAYLPLQRDAYAYNINKWLKDAAGGKEIEMMTRVRDMNMTTSLGVFCGMKYLPENADLELSEAYRVITYAFQLVNIPFAIPGTAVYDAVCAREKIMHYLTLASEKSHARLAKGEPAESLLDRWVDALEKERASWIAGGSKGNEPRKFTHREIALTVMTMIFASQDASTSSIVWAIQALADHPHILQRVREEQKLVRPNNEDIDYESMCKMEFTWRVVKELLRYRPPVTMMLYEAKTQTDLGGHPIDKGTLVVASTYPSLHDPSVYKNPEKFDPDRFLSDDPALQQNYMVWGHGPHMCIGRDYAMSHMVAFVATLATTCEWDHCITPDSEKIMIIATLYPVDKCRIKLRPLVR